MPSSGYGSEYISLEDYLEFEKDWEWAKQHGLQVEWLGCFVAALRQGADLDTASWAGIEEWDL